MEIEPKENAREPSSADTRVRTAAFWFAVLGAMFGASVFMWTIYIIAVRFRYWEKVLLDHFAAIVGLPGAALVAFAIVVFLRQTDGPIEFEGLTLKFKGAAGQVIMWVICFIAIASAIHLLW